MLRALFALSLLLISGYSLANEKTLANETTVFDETFNWQMQLGFSIQHRSVVLAGVEQSDLSHYLNISILLDLYYKGFFIQSNHRRSDTHTLGAELGYQLIVEDSWELDIITKNYIVGFNPINLMDELDKYIPELDGVEKRDNGEGLALRYTRFFDDSYYSVDIANLSALSDAKGWLAEIFYSHIYPYRNWDIYFNASLTLYSADVMDYYVGIDPNETSAIRPQYQVDESFKAQVELFIQHPISESWTFNAGISHSFYSSEVGNSPIVGRQDTTHIMAGVLYVF